MCRWMASEALMTTCSLSSVLSCSSDCCPFFFFLLGASSASARFGNTSHRPLPRWLCRLLLFFLIQARASSKTFDFVLYSSCFFFFLVFSDRSWKVLRIVSISSTASCGTKYRTLYRSNRCPELLLLFCCGGSFQFRLLLLSSPMTPDRRSSLENPAPPALFTCKTRSILETIVLSTADPSVLLLLAVIRIMAIKKVASSKTE
mmetsp:Transcript_2519/g.6066  ORF Transcript_2519/g.6066 Transcript_2519/m.6066 type:complete len:203 (+) Transcript_2519:970-1578(+)